MSEKIWGSYPDQWILDLNWYEIWDVLWWNWKVMITNLTQSLCWPQLSQCNISQHSDVCWNDLIRILSLNLIRCFSDLSFYKKLMLNKIFWYYTFMFQSLIIIMKRILNSKVDSRSNDSISMTMTKSQINSQNYKWSNQINIGQGQNMVWQGWTDTWRILSHHLVKIMKESSCFSYQYFCLSFGN